MSCTMLIDGGTTNTRVTLLDENAAVLAQSRRDAGVRLTAIDGDNRRLREAVRDCVQEALAQGGRSDVSACIAYGMLTSGLGLCELPHAVAPVSADELRAATETRSFPDIAPFPITFLRGVRNPVEHVAPDSVGAADMMRGEETEAVGLHSLLKPEGACVLVLPGSHNKFISMDAQGRILGCMTSVSGELLDAFTHHTILSEAVDGHFADASTYDRALMLAGAKACRESGVGRAAFSARILRTLGGYSPAQTASFLLGVVLCSDVQALEHFPDASGSIYVAGKEPLQTALCDLLTERGHVAHAVPRELSSRMGVAGALRIGKGEAV